jgi:hypothetical protein
MGMSLEPRLAVAAARSIIRAKPTVVKGEPHSLTKTKRGDGLSRWSGADGCRCWTEPQRSSRHGGLSLELHKAYVADFRVLSAGGK